MNLTLTISQKNYFLWNEKLVQDLIILTLRYEDRLKQLFFNDSTILYVDDFICYV